MTMIDYIKDTNQVVTLSIRREDTPMNVIDAEFFKSLELQFDRALKEDGLKGIIITSGKKEFIVTNNGKGRTITTEERFKTIDITNTTRTGINTLDITPRGTITISTITLVKNEQ